MAESGSGTLSGWTVEARSTGDRPEICNGTNLGAEWQELGFSRAPIGVPRGKGYEIHWLDLTGRYSYKSAQALRWWWLSAAGFCSCVETRLVRYDITYSYAVKRKGSGYTEGFDTTRDANSTCTDEADE